MHQEENGMTAVLWFKKVKEQGRREDPASIVVNVLAWPVTLSALKRRRDIACDASWLL
jgi:hypothetical protein